MNTVNMSTALHKLARLAKVDCGVSDSDERFATLHEVLLFMLVVVSLCMYVYYVSCFVFHYLHICLMCFY